MYYQPKLSDGILVPLPWQLRLITTYVIWPLQDNSTRWMRILNICFISIVLFSLVMAAESALLFFINNLSDINLCTDALASFVIYNESIVRIFGMVLQKDSLKLFFKEFYGCIYVHEKEDAKMSKLIRRSLIPINCYSCLHLVVILTFCLEPMVSAILYNTRLLPHRLQLHYRFEDPPVLYGLTLLHITCNGWCTVTFIISQACLLGNLVYHLCARYTMLQNELEKSVSALTTVEPSEVTQKFRSILDDIIGRTNKLNLFAMLLNEVFTFQIFSMVSHSTITLCILIFQTSTLKVGSAKFVAYLVWMIAKILELVIVGSLGTKLKTTTDNTSSMYYHCNWEAFVHRSTDRRQNVLLMKQITLAISLYRKPIELNGFGIFNLSLDTTASLIRGAGSYFTALKTFT